MKNKSFLAYITYLILTILSSVGCRTAGSSSKSLTQATQFSATMGRGNTLVLAAKTTADTEISRYNLNSLVCEERFLIHYRVNALTSKGDKGLILNVESESKSGKPNNTLVEVDEIKVVTELIQIDESTRDGITLFDNRLFTVKYNRWSGALAGKPWGGPGQFSEITQSGDKSIFSANELVNFQYGHFEDEFAVIHLGYGAKGKLMLFDKKLNTVGLIENVSDCYYASDNGLKGQIACLGYKVVLIVDVKSRSIAQRIPLSRRAIFAGCASDGVLFVIFHDGSSSRPELFKILGGNEVFVMKL